MWPWRHTEKHITSSKNAKVIEFPKREEREMEYFKHFESFKETLTLSDRIGVWFLITLKKKNNCIC